MRRLYSKNWELFLEKKMLESDKNKPKAYICSPLNAMSDDEILHNMHLARAYMHYVVEKIGYLAKAPHAYLPILLCDEIQTERVIALQFGLQLLETCDLLLVCGKRISAGMHAEIAHAVKLKLPIYTFCNKVYLDVIEAIRQNKGDTELVFLDMNHEVLSRTNLIRK